MKMLRAGGIVFGLFLGVIGSAKASTLDYAFTFSGTGFNGSGDITVNTTTNAIQGLSGTVNGSSVQLIAANPLTCTRSLERACNGFTMTCFSRAARRSTIMAYCSVLVPVWLATYTRSGRSFIFR